MNNKLAKLVLALMLSLASLANAAAAEVDSFSLATQKLSDSLPVLDVWVSNELEAAVTQANKSARVLSKRRHPKTQRLVHRAKEGVTYCNQSFLYEQLTGRLAQTLVGQLEIYAEQSDEIDRRKVPFSSSIYRDFILTETPSITSSERLSSVINLAGVYVGTDKLGHFFTEGHTYYKKADLDNEGLESALKFGVFTESLYFGALTTGVFSYADLVANYQGYQFWRRVMSHEEESYIQCVNQEWSLGNSFTFQVYLDEGWDETVNCSLFRNEVLLAKVLLRLGEGRCGGAKENYQNLKDKYQNHYSQLVNDSGHRLLPDELTPDRVLERFIADEDLGGIAQSALVRSKAIYLEWEQSNTEKR